MFSKNACLTGTAMLIPVGLHHLIRCFARQIRLQGKLIPGTVRNSKITNRGPNRWLLCTFEMYILFQKEHYFLGLIKPYFLGLIKLSWCNSFVRNWLSLFTFCLQIGSVS